MIETHTIIPLNSRGEAIRNVIKENQGATTHQVSDILGLNDHSVKENVEKMEKSSSIRGVEPKKLGKFGIITRDGINKFFFTDDFYNPSDTPEIAALKEANAIREIRRKLKNKKTVNKK